MTEWTWMKVYENTKSQNNKNGSDNDINSDNINCADGRGDDDVKISYPWQILISTLPTITDQVITRTIKHVSGTHSHGRRLHSKIIWLVESLPGVNTHPCLGLWLRLEPLCVDKLLLPSLEPCTVPAPTEWKAVSLQNPDRGNACSGVEPHRQSGLNKKQFRYMSC